MKVKWLFLLILGNLYSQDDLLINLQELYPKTFISSDTSDYFEPISHDNNSSFIIISSDYSCCINTSIQLKNISTTNKVTQKITLVRSEVETLFTPIQNDSIFNELKKLDFKSYSPLIPIKKFDLIKNFINEHILS